MGSLLMRAKQPAQPTEPAEVPNMASQNNQTIATDLVQSQNDEVDQSRPPVSPEMGPSPTQDVSNVEPVLDPPPGNWEAKPDDLYTQRQRVPSPPMVTSDVHRPTVSVPKMVNQDAPSATSVPGAAPKARGPPLPITEAKQQAVVINVPVPIRQRMNPHMPPPRISVPIPEMPYAMHPRGFGTPFPMTHVARVPLVPETTHDANSQRALPLRRQVRTIRVPLRGHPPTPPIPPRHREFDVRYERPPFTVFTPVPGIARSPSVVGAPWGPLYGRNSHFHNPEKPSTSTKEPRSWTSHYETTET